MEVISSIIVASVDCLTNDEFVGASVAAVAEC